jgi:hypothetical protein
MITILEKSKKSKRIIHYYYLEFQFNDSFYVEDGDQFGETFRIINTLTNFRDEIRYQEFGEKSIFIQNVHLEKEKKMIEGKLLCIRKDILPEIMNTKTDTSRGIEAKEEEGLVETTHFVINYSKGSAKLAIEYNQFGARIGDFIRYIEGIGINKNLIVSVGFTPVVKDELPRIQARIKRISEFVVKVHKDNIEEIKNLDDNTYSALKLSMDNFKSEYATLVLKFDYRLSAETQEMKRSLFNLIQGLLLDRSKSELFNHLSVRAEDSSKDNLLENFDLLIDKVKSEISVQKKQRYRTVVSEEMFDKMKLEILRNGI